MTLRKYLVLVSVTICAAVGETLLSRGMKQIGNVSPSHLASVIFAVTNPWVALGISVFARVFCYLQHCPLLGRPHLCSSGNFPQLRASGVYRTLHAS